MTTAQESGNPILWSYAYDNNGSLTEILPDGNPANGARRYSYNTAGYLVRAETYAGASYQLQADMLYNGLGQRLSMTAYPGGLSVTTNYVLDPMQNARPLTATSGGNTTVYFYGLDPLAELTTSWSYSLPDGTGTPRQLTNNAGEITLAGRYTPWGDALDYAGTGNFTFGYFGGLMDSATGLLYVGNGQYYDPATGRFLTRQAQPDKTNPYVPWGNPTGAILAPLAVVGLIYGRKRKKNGFDTFVIVLFVAVGVGMGLAACGPVSPTGSSQPPTIPPSGASTPDIPVSTQTPAPVMQPSTTATSILDQIFPYPCPTPTFFPLPGSTPVPNDTSFRSYGIGERFYKIFEESPGGWWDNYRDSDAGLWPILISMAFYWETRTLDHNQLFVTAMQEAFSRKLWESYKNYGKDGWAYYLGGREPVRRYIDELEKYKGNWAALEAKLESTYQISYSVADATYNSSGKEIWRNTSWQNGYDWNRPWEFGNPTEKSPPMLLSALQGEVSSCNGHCTDPSSIYFKDTRLNLDSYYINPEGIKVYTVAFILTPAQQNYFCGTANCVKP